MSLVASIAAVRTGAAHDRNNPSIYFPLIGLLASDRSTTGTL